MNLCTLSRRPRAEGRNKCSTTNFAPNGSKRDDRPFSMANNNNNNNYGSQQTINTNRPPMHPFKGLKGGRGNSLTSACRNSFDSDDPELEEIEFNKRGPGFHSFSDDIDLNLDEVEPIYSEPEFKNEPREFDFHIYDLLSVREGGGSYRCLQNEKQSNGKRREGNDASSSDQGKQYCQGRERLWGGGGGVGQPQKSQHWSQLGLLSDPKVTQWSQLGGQLSSDSDYASYDASVPGPANGRGKTNPKMQYLSGNPFYQAHSFQRVGNKIFGKSLQKISLVKNASVEKFPILISFSFS